MPSGTGLVRGEYPGYRGSIGCYSRERSPRQVPLTQGGGEQARAVAAGIALVKGARLIRSKASGKELGEEGLKRCSRWSRRRAMSPTFPPRSEVISSYHDRWHWNSDAG